MNTLTGFDRIIERRIAANEMTCASYTVCIDGEVVRQNALGLADRTTGLPLREDAVMRLASMTKPVTGVAVMRARELGLLDLDDEVIDPALHLSAVLFKNIAGGFGSGAPTSREFEREVVAEFKGTLP